MFYRIGNTEIVSLDSESIVSRIALNEEYLTVTFRDGHSRSVDSCQEDYETYVRFVSSCPLLVSELQAQTLRSTQSKYADPFLEEMPHTFFTAFQAFPNARELELRLSEDGAGSLWTKGSHPRCALEWSEFTEGLHYLLDGGKHGQLLAS